MSASEAPTTVLQGRYELRERIGRGGMGVVWAATDTLLQRRVAVKQVTLPSGVAPEEVELIRARVLREAMIRREDAEEAGRSPNPIHRALSRLPRRLGYHLGPGADQPGKMRRSRR